MDLPQHIRSELENLLDEVKAVFDFDVKVTLVVRSGKIPGGDVVLTNDNLGQVAGALMRDEHLS